MRSVFDFSQVLVELDDIFLPLHRKSIQERQRWQGALYDYALPGNLVREMQAS
jgi:hypothetical protein